MANNYTQYSFLLPYYEMHGQTGGHPELCKRALEFLENLMEDNSYSGDEEDFDEAYLAKQLEAEAKTENDKRIIPIVALAASNLIAGELPLPVVKVGKACDGVYIYADDNYSPPESCVYVAQMFATVLGLEGPWTLEWVNTCDKPRVGEFSGGMVVFDRFNEVWWNSQETEQALKAQLSKKS